MADDKTKDRYQEWGVNFFKGMGCFFVGLFILLVVIAVAVLMLIF